MGIVEEFNEYRSRMNEKIDGTMAMPHLRRAFEFWEELGHV